MSTSPYPVLGDRPIDQWKVTELKQELKKRKLTLNGLKSDLVKRLDEALRLEKEENEESENEERENAAMEDDERENAAMEDDERENAAKEDEIKDANHGFNSEPQTVVAEKGSEAVPITTDEAAGIVESNKSTKVDDANLHLDSPTAFGQDKGRDKVNLCDTNTVTVEELTVHSTSLGDVTKVSESLASDGALGNLGGQGSQESETQELTPNLNSQLDDEIVKAAHKDDNLASSASDKQVSVGRHNLGIQVKSDSICTDSVSFNENIELKDNIIADNVKIEIDVIKPEIMGPSSSDVVPLGGESHPMDVEEPLEKEVSAEEKDDKIGTNADINKNNDAADVGSSEKLNLDRSSGDDSMEDDVLESKQIDSKYNSDYKSENKAPVVNEDIHVDVLGDGVSDDRKGSPLENKSQPAEKRKHHDQEAVGNSEPVKRQRRWNTEPLKISEQQSSNITVSTTPKDSIQSPSLKRNYSRSDSTASDDVPKERIVPPSQKPPTNSLRIDHFLRPFTLKAVQELLGKTGSVTSFWMDQIKTHCYVAYSSVEEALETRNAVYNLQWPSNGGRLLVAEFVDPEEVKMRVAPPTVNTVAPPPKQAQSSPRLQAPRQQLPPPPMLPPPPPPMLPPPPPMSNAPLARERHPLPPPPEKIEAPIVTLDDLFRKTKAVPRIYYLPLSEEQVASRSINTKQ